MPRYCRDTAVDLVLHRLVRAGWRVVRGGKHLKAYRPGGQTFVSIAITPGDHRTRHNTIAKLRRAERS